MKRFFAIVLCLSLCISLLAGCICKHAWTDADCINARICISCGKTEGEPLGHTWADASCTAAKTCSVCGATEGEPLPHTWIEANCTAAKTCSVCETAEGKPLGHTIVRQLRNPDVIAATVHQEEYCSVCNEQISSGTVPLETMIVDDMFLFTPNEFMERLAIFTDKYVHTFSCEFVLSDLGLAAFVEADHQEIIVQFIGANEETLTVDDLDSPKVWCVSLTQVGEMDEKFRQSFLMACDPALTKDTAYRVNVGLTSALLQSAYTGEPFAYTKYNELLYETTRVYVAMPESDFAMEMLNVYASDFRYTEPEVVIPNEGIL